MEFLRKFRREGPEQTALGYISKASSVFAGNPAGPSAFPRTLPLLKVADNVKFHGDFAADLREMQREELHEEEGELKSAPRRINKYYF